MIAFIFTLILSCSSDEKLQKIEGTSVRIGKARGSADSDLVLELFTDKKGCERLLRGDTESKEFEDCLPWVNRGAGEVRISLAFMLGFDLYPLPVEIENLDVTHEGNLVEPDSEMGLIELIPHDPIRVPQLFIVLIDTSGSMSIQDDYASKNRMSIVKSALSLSDVKKAFFPSDVSNRVILLEFTEGRPKPVGGKIKLIQDMDQYQEEINKIKPGGGFTHLYDSIRYGAIDLLKNDEIKEWMELNEAAPTVIALTDGFNNQRGVDICADNAPRLQELIKDIREVRTDEELDIRYRPTIYTVGLGTPIQSKFTLPQEERMSVTVNKLCSRRFAEKRIDGVLENQGIDNASLVWIADAGKGKSFVSRSADGLGTAFKAAAAERYRWYELRYRIDPRFLRRSFTTKVSLNTFAETESEVKLYPNSWIDLAPGKHRDQDEWTEKQSVLHSFSILLPILSMLVFLPILSPAFMNIRRIILGRRRRPMPPNQ